MFQKSAGAVYSSTYSLPYPISSSYSTPLFTLTNHCPYSRHYSHSFPSKPFLARNARRYATRPTESDHSEVPHWPRSPRPTPYEIFGIQRGAPYTKRRFYQLVKLYHPDTRGPAASTGSSSADQLSNAARLERYRLVVAANDILSDPQKRRLYDHHGIGWIDGHRSHDLREADEAWRHQPGNASRNATWEDWERWRDARDGKPGETMYMSNGVFAALVVCLCMIGALAQMNRAESVGEQYVDFVQQKDSAIGRKIRENTVAASGRTKDERVGSFLRERENLLFDFQPGKLDSSPSQPTRPE
ncbi:J domain-containing protein 1 [Conoideocrella luteorostrata]|uniref:J domain-containing protein 1 n=1 Tax=Conoideocrella luteorostrata TaxID=1105319 RepID=A0AAJ0CPH6_9HYPO|nr:J domain-containing protein 1 [Conoideocrella luteorostrata]